MARLLNTLGIGCCAKVIQKRQRLSAGLLLGSGKVEEICQMAKDQGATHIVIDHPLSGSQSRNIEEMTACRVMDRSAVILDIFAKHAKTKEARTQVEIARLEYMMPRMVGAWTHFAKQEGSGTGEKQIEMDRRKARELILLLQKKLKIIRKERDVKSKMRRNELKVSIVGYTNSGKTTLMNMLTNSGAKGEDRLFATLDASVRSINPGTHPNVLLSDTVGFIRNLPPTLVASFKSTLEEVLSANLLLHIIDVSADQFELQMKTTEDVLGDIGAGDIPVILVFNKIDRLEDPFRARLLRKRFPNCFLLSALSAEDVKKLNTHIISFFTEQFSEVTLALPFGEQEAWSLVHRNCVILDVSYEIEGLAYFRVKAAPAIVAKLKEFIIED